MTDFALPPGLADQILAAVNDPAASGLAAIRAVDLIAPLVLRHGEPALLAVASVLADQIIADLELEAYRQRHGGGPVTPVIRDTQGQIVTLDTAPPGVCRNHVLAYQFALARLNQDTAEQLVLARHLGDQGSGLLAGLAQAARTHHQQQRAKAQPR